MKNIQKKLSSKNNGGFTLSGAVKKSIYLTTVIVSLVFLPSVVFSQQFDSEGNPIFAPAAPTGTVAPRASQSQIRRIDNSILNTGTSRTGSSQGSGIQGTPNLDFLGSDSQQGGDPAGLSDADTIGDSAIGDLVFGAGAGNIGSIAATCGGADASIGGGLSNLGGATRAALANLLSGSGGTGSGAGDPFGLADADTFADSPVGSAGGGSTLGGLISGITGGAPTGNLLGGGVNSLLREAGISGGTLNTANRLISGFAGGNLNLNNAAGAVLGNILGLPSGGTSAQLLSGGANLVAGGLQNLGVSLGSQGIADIGNNISSFLGGGGNLGGITSGLGGLTSSLSGLTSLAGPLSGMLGFGGGDNIPVDTVTINQQVEQIRGSTGAVKQKDYCLDALQRKQNDIALAGLTRSALNYIETGFPSASGDQGSPLFITQPQDFYRDVKNKQLRTLINDINDPESGLSDEEKAQLSQSVVEQNRETIYDKIRPTLAEDIQRSVCSDPNSPHRSICGLNPRSASGRVAIEECFRRDFSCGGYDGLLSSLSPNNNPYAREAVIRSEAVSRASQAVAEEKEEIATNRGYRNVKVCLERDRRGVDDNDFVNEDRLPCLRWKVETPGDVVATIGQQVTKTPWEKLQLSDSLGETFDLPFQFLTQGLFQIGLRELGEVATGPQQTQYNALYAQDLATGISSSLTRVREYGDLVDQVSTNSNQALALVTQMQGVCNSISDYNAQAAGFTGWGAITINDCLDEGQPVRNELESVGSYYEYADNYLRQKALIASTTALLTNLESRARATRSQNEITTITDEFQRVSTNIITVVNEGNTNNVTSQLSLVRGKITSITNLISGLRGRLAQGRASLQAAIAARQAEEAARFNN